MNSIQVVSGQQEKMERNASSRRVRRPIPRRIRPSPYPVRSCCLKVSNAEAAAPTKPKLSLALEKKDWEDATCSVCMEYPHNAVLLLCSSHDKGCRPYMCGTSYRHSNCLDQFKQAYTKVHSETASENLKPELAACPLCRGQVKGWTIVEPAREYLNKKERSCMQDECSYIGTYKDLQKHVRAAHPCAKPREVDPTLQQKWTQLEHEMEREDVMSTIRQSMPRSVVFGDYVIEVNSNSNDESSGSENDEGLSSGRGISRSILYFFLREGARLMSIESSEDGDAGPDAGPLGGGGDVGPESQGGGGGGRRRRRRRSRVRSGPDSS